MEEESKNLVIDKRRNFAQAIALKLIQNKSLNSNELSFMQNMCARENNAQYGEFLKQLNTHLIWHPDFASNPDTVIDNFHKNIMIGTQLLKATDQGKRDEASARNSTVSALNKYSKLLAEHDQRNAIKGHPSSAPIDVESEELTTDSEVSSNDS